MLLLPVLAEKNAKLEDVAAEVEHVHPPTFRKARLP